MSQPQRKMELVLIVCFLAIMGLVPVTQVLIELQRGERVQFTDVFRYRFTAANLRQYERALEDKSWLQQAARPQVQQVLFQTLGDPGAKAMLGRNGWIFYRPDVRYLVEPDRVDVNQGQSKFVPPSGDRTVRENVVQAIVRFQRQLQERGIHLLVMPVPGKPSIYPDQLTRRLRGKERELASPTLELLRRLEAQGVRTVNLFDCFQAYRADSRSTGGISSLYLAQDTHWTPQGAKLAAQSVAHKLKTLGWASAATNHYQTRPVRVKRHGDILEMMQIPRLTQHFPATEVVCEQIRDPKLGLMIPSESERQGAYRHPGQPSTMLLLGDSFCRIYQMAEPRSLGEVVDPSANPSYADPATSPGNRRLLPGSAGFLSHLTLALGAPVDAIVSDGGAASDVRQKLSTHAEILEGKKVVIWEFVERDIRLGQAGWPDLPLPPQLGL